MVLKFQFQLESYQGVFEQIGLRVGREVGVKVGLHREGRVLEIYGEGEVEELERFGARLGEELPMSIFLRGAKVDVAEEFRDTLPRHFPRLYLPPCPRCLREATDPNSPHYCNPFHRCSICGYPVEGEEWESSLPLEERSFPALFRGLAEQFLEEGVLELQMMNGPAYLFRNPKEGEVVVARDLGAVGRYFISTEGEGKGLGAIEKPLLYLHPALPLRREFGVEAPVVPVKLPDDLVLELLFRHLPLEVGVVGLKRGGSCRHLSFSVGKVGEPPVVVATDSRRLDPVLERGERGVVPVAIPKKGEEGAEVVGKFRNYWARYRGIGEGWRLLEVEIGTPPGGEGKEAYPQFGGIYGVLEGWDLYSKPLLCYSLWREEGGLFLHSPTAGLSKVWGLHCSYPSFEVLFREIEEMNETGGRLISNFRQKLPELYNRALSVEIGGEGGLYYLWGVVGTLLGFGESWREGAEGLIAEARGVIGKKGPRIDYRPVAGGSIDPRWVVRTCISFLLAGVEPQLIGYGVLESGAEYLSNIYLSLEKEIQLEGAVLVGDLLEGVFLNKLYTYLERNFPVYTPTGLPVTGEGAAAIGSLAIASRHTP